MVPNKPLQPTPSRQVFLLRLIWGAAEQRRSPAKTAAKFGDIDPMIDCQTLNALMGQSPDLGRSRMAALGALRHTKSDWVECVVQELMTLVIRHGGLLIAGSGGCS
jgi:hypothetical protein